MYACIHPYMHTKINKQNNKHTNKQTHTYIYTCVCEKEETETKNEKKESNKTQKKKNQTRGWNAEARGTPRARLAQAEGGRISPNKAPRRNVQHLARWQTHGRT